MNLHNDILESIGNTPMVKVNNIDTGKCDLLLKLENLNPGGSIKDRVGKSIIESAEENGLLKPGGTIIECTAGNTGLGLALPAILKGYKLILVIPDKMSEEKLAHLGAMGIEIILTRSDVQKGDPEYYTEVAAKLVKNTPNSFFANQFSNPANPYIHETTTGPEIWDQTNQKVDAFVAGVGTGGTISGIGRYLKSQNPDIDIIVADPEGSVVADAVNHGTFEYSGGQWLVEGIGEDYIPDNLDLSIIDEGIYVSDKEAFEMVNLLLRKEGILAGSSCGTLVKAAADYCKSQKSHKTVVSLICDTGNKYLSKAFNNAWLSENL